MFCWFPYAACAIIDVGAPTARSQSHQRLPPSICLRPLDSSYEKPYSLTHYAVRKNAPPSADCISRRSRVRYNGLGLCSRCLRVPRPKDTYLFQHSSWEDGRVGHWMGRIECEEYGNYPRPHPPLAYRHHCPTGEESARPPAGTDAKGAAVKTSPFFLHAL